MDYGNPIGMHFGNKAAAYDRAMIASGSRTLIHTARLNAPRTATMTDEQANFGSEATRKVKAGEVVPYVNTFEGAGSVSYRAKPESVRTWSEDVQSDPNSHPALKHLADRGYNPTLSKYEDVSHPGVELDTFFHGPPAKQLFEADLVAGGKAIAHGSEDDMFDQWRNNTGKNAGVVRNNINTGQFNTDAVAKAKPRMRPTR